MVTSAQLHSLTQDTSHILLCKHLDLHLLVLADQLLLFSYIPTDKYFELLNLAKSKVFKIEDTIKKIKESLDKPGDIGLIKEKHNEEQDEIPF